ncbi:hypothetical protein ACCS37_32285 [Rhizobium ruizarguesonis]
MKKVTLWTAGGVALATICGLAGLHHLSASIVTLTVFLAAPALLVAVFDTLPRLLGSSRDNA